MIYRTASDFRRALEDRLTTQARAEQRVDPNRLRVNVAFERFLARLFHDGTKRWVLKAATRWNCATPAAPAPPATST